MKPEKYLNRHGEPEAQTLLLRQVFEHVLVLPCYDEQQQPVQELLHFCTRNNALAIIVVNQPDHVAHCDNNDHMLRWIRRQHCEMLAPQVYFCIVDGQSTLLIDRTGLRIPRAQGVGLARKIGADCAYALIVQGQVASPWIFGTDADATLPDDYFDAPDAYGNASAVVYPFEHVASGDEAIDFATALYELRLHHYVAGLRHARSPYAFHSLGSTLAINARHYAAAHGFPKRAGGEDFYLLNKLAKLAPVQSLQTPLLRLRSRASHRVPFGTGPAVSKLAACDDELAQAMFYHPAGFELLACWLDFFTMCAQQLCDNKPASDWQQWLAVHTDAHNAELLLQTIDAAEFESMLHKAQRQCRGAAALQRYLHTWFDGFRTLKLLHALRDRYFPLQNFHQCFGATQSEGSGSLAHITSLSRGLRATVSEQG